MEEEDPGRLSSLPYPPEAIKQGLKTLAVVYQERGELDDAARRLLALSYLSLAFFMPDEVAELFEEIEEASDAQLERWLKDDAFGARMAAAGQFMVHAREQAEALEKEFEEYLKELESGKKA